MKRTGCLLLVSVFALAMAISSSAEGQRQIPFKTVVQGVKDGTVEVVLTVFSARRGGDRLFEEKQTVQVENGILFTMIGERTPGGVPAEVFQNNRVWIEMALASAPQAPVGTRMASTIRAGAIRDGAQTEVLVNVPVDDTLCFTCGGAWPVFNGSLNQAGCSSVNTGACPTERGSLCGGGHLRRVDTRPFLCSRP
jgi:hypothetical protein